MKFECGVCCIKKPAIAAVDNKSIEAGPVSVYPSDFESNNSLFMENIMFSS